MPIKEKINIVDIGKNKVEVQHNLLAFPEPKSFLADELKESRLLRQINDEFQVYLIDGAKCHSLMREIGRLREIAFQFVGEGTGQVRDIDPYDNYYQQIVLWNSQKQVIIGGYRIAKAGEVIEFMGIKGLYNHRLFEFHEAVKPKLNQGIELGRSFINPEH